MRHKISCLESNFTLPNSRASLAEQSLQSCEYLVFWLLAMKRFFLTKSTAAAKNQNQTKALITSSQKCKTPLRICKLFKQMNSCTIILFIAIRSANGEATLQDVDTELIYKVTKEFFHYSHKCLKPYKPPYSFSFPFPTYLSTDCVLFSALCYCSLILFITNYFGNTVGHLKSTLIEGMKLNCSNKEVINTCHAGNIFSDIFVALCTFSRRRDMLSILCLAKGKSRKCCFQK